ncbi:type IV secretory system conjugative DNA transfer family protein (plasmid) [Nocardiopsis eucommiae]|uniref:Type IV secretory system conjugative DNA transfer family protein n=1 Tax=Nocardiopsis eucommiae TaxID=2831970 RepID=A0A975QL70_9ACTN|nr:type IV secretory system conjugative DNA transfer family protein [Nocardiopsis eucommiae]
MSRTLGPDRGPLQNAQAPWLILGGLWGLVVIFASVWAAAWVAARLTGGEVSSFGGAWVGALVRGETEQTWPGTPTPVVIAVAVVVLLVVTVVASLIARVALKRRSSPDDPVAAINRDSNIVAEAGPEATRERAIGLRAPLKNKTKKEQKKLPGEEIGLALGDIKLPGDRTGPTLYASWEDTIVAIMAPRAGKTTSLAIPHILSSSFSPVLVTSNKPDVWQATVEIREKDTGQQSWLFDPQGITHTEQLWWWNPLQGITSVEDAFRLAGHFVLTVDDGQNKDMWGPAAADLLCAFILAAAGAGEDMNTVATWLDDELLPTPVEILREMGQHPMASSLKGAQDGAPETRAGIYQTARTAAKCLRDPQIMKWVTPPETALPSFDADSFVVSQETLYLMSKAGAGAAAPLVAALTDRVLRAGENAAEQQGGRLDNPLIAVLDEAANICKIADLPDLYSHFGSRGIIPVTILQSRKQGVGVWGENKFDALWGAATRKIIGAGIDDPTLARDLSTMVGQHDVTVSSVSYAERTSESVSLRRQEILSPDAIRAMPRGSALMMATGMKPALIKLKPWYTSARAKEIGEAFKRAEKDTATRAARKREGAL